MSLCRDSDTQSRWSPWTCWWTWELETDLSGLVSLWITSIKVDRELIVRVCGVCCWICKQCNIRAGNPTNKTPHTFTAEASCAFILWHTGKLWLTSSHFINLLPRFRLSDTRTGLSWSAWTPGWAPAIQASTFTPKTAVGRKKIKSLSFFSGKKPKQSAQDDSETVLVNGSASLRTRMVI